MCSIGAIDLWGPIPESNSDLGAPPVSTSKGNLNSVSEIIGVVRVEFFTRGHGFTGIRAKVFSPQLRR